MSYIGENLKRARKNKGWTQEQTAEMTGISSVMLSQYERGVRNPKLDIIRKIADALGVDVGELVFIESRENRPVKSVNDSNERINKLVDLLSQYPDSVGSKALDDFIFGLSDLSVLESDELKEHCLEYLSSIVRGFGEIAVHCKTMGSVPKSLPDSYRRFIGTFRMCQQELQTYIRELEDYSHNHLSGQSPVLRKLIENERSRSLNQLKRDNTARPTAAVQDDTDTKEGDQM